MNIKYFFFIALIYHTHCERKIGQPVSKVKTVVKNTKITSEAADTARNVTESHKDELSISKPIDQAKIANTMKVKIPPSRKNKKQEPKIISPDLIQKWAEKISQKFYKIEKQVVRRETLLKSFSDIKFKFRNGSAIVDKMASALEDLLQRRAQMAKNIMMRAQALAEDRTSPPDSYLFQMSSHLNKVKKKDVGDPTNEYMLPTNCTQLTKLNVSKGTHFDGAVSLEDSSVQVAAEVYPCDQRIKGDIFWSEDLLPTFRHNYAQDSSVDFQYFCSAKGFLRHYPAGVWSSMFKLELNPDGEEEGVADVYDCRLRPWYVAASGAPRDVLILLDASGSMTNSSNLVNAEQFTLALLSALTDDDMVNVLRFNVIVESPISCFADKLVPANHVNSAAMVATVKNYRKINESLIPDALTEGVGLLRRQQSSPDRPPACQQVIVLLTDSLYENFTDKMRALDPSGRIRLFVLWLHDKNGLRDNTREFGEWLSCSSDGSFAPLETSADVTEQVMRILRVLERPLVAQRNRSVTAFSDLYAHVEDPRRSDYHWMEKENEEQAYRYKQLRLNKRKLVSEAQRDQDYRRQESLDKLGHYYEGQDVNYRLQISVSVPVFDAAQSENITITLNEEKQRNSTRTYPVNRLLGVAGVDIPIDHLKLILPYHELGAGGSLFLINHRGNIVIHDDIKPTFDGDILKPGYRTVDVLDLEQPGIDLQPRDYSQEWLEFRKALVIEESTGNRTMFGKSIFEDGMRAILETREYYWRRVMDHYTAVVVLPKYNKHHAVPEGSFTQQLAASAFVAIGSEFSVHPDWLYCRHVDPRFDQREAEVRHFISRRKDEPDFQMQKLKHVFSPIKFIPLLERNYQCNEELMARLCKEAIATAPWANFSTTDHDCSPCELGSVVAFFASESGLTRWQQYHATSPHALPPEGGAWPRGPQEPWYRRAAAAPDLLHIHAPLAPIRKMRNTDIQPPPLGVQYKWFTAARALGHPDKGMVGVAGYHFHPLHLEDVLKAVTNFSCADEEEECEARCDGAEWSCVLVDEGGWVVAGHWRGRLTDEDPAREHLAALHPQAMYALLTAKVFKLHWIHDYQAVCFPPQDENAAGAAASIMPSIMRSLWRSVSALLHVTREVVTIINLISSGGVVAGDTQLESEKRRNRTLKDFAREKFDRLYDERVLVNRTRIAACDRSRAFYELQRTPKAMDALRRPVKPDRCSWPLVGTVVPKTNLLLLAIFNPCKHDGRPVPDPLINESVNMSDGNPWQLRANMLACWRNRVPLPVRAPPTPCYAHNYTQEEGYRQCGPWLPNPDQDEESASRASNLSNRLFCVALLLYAIRI